MASSDAPAPVRFGVVEPGKPTPTQVVAAQQLEDGVGTADLPIINLALFMGQEGSPEAQAECEKVAEALHTYGCLLVRDPRVSSEDNDRFVDTMERYFEQPTDDKMKDVRSELHYQIGATPDFIERPRDHCARMDTLPEGNRPVSLCPPEHDPKWRFFWRIGERPTDTRFPDLNAEPVKPAALPEFPEVMDMWGNKMLGALEQVARMAAQGFGLPRETLRDYMQLAPHLLAPTGSNFYKYGELGTVLAGYHYDLNFMTIHGRSRFPGLYIWLRDGRKLNVKVPENCLLVQAGRQFEYISGGYVLAGYHEVLVSPATVQAIDRARAEHRSLWRVSSTLFGHLASDRSLKPLPEFVRKLQAGAEDPAAVAADVAEQFPDILVGEQVQLELRAIKLKATPVPSE